MKGRFLLFLFLFLAGQAFSQYYYLPSTTQGNPGGLNTDNEYPNGSGLDASWEVLLGGGNTSPTWSPTDTIPFTFNFNGSPVSTFKVSSTGVLTFTTSSTSIPVSTNAAIPDPGIPDNSVMVWGIEGSGSNDAIVTKTFGNVGSQQYWVFLVPTQQGVGPTGPLFLKKAQIKYTLLIKDIVETLIHKSQQEFKLITLMLLWLLGLLT